MDKRALPVISDARFAKMHSDPRFQRVPKSVQKVKVDDRFAGMFTEKSFKDKAPIDEYGRHVDEEDSEVHLDRLYQVEDDSSKSEKAAAVDDQSVESRSMEANTVAKKAEKKKETKRQTKKAAEAKKGREKARKGKNRVEQEAEDEKEESTIQDGETVIMLEPEEDFAAAEEIEAETARFAILSCDWDNIRAEDLFYLCHSFLPPGGSLRAVTVYPSQLGLERMAQEARAGPVLAPAGGGAADGEDAESVDGLRKIEQQVRQKRRNAAAAGGANNHEEQQRRIRKYELEKMRYYYGVAEFDSPGTALAVYSEIDGLELMRTSNVIDCRFVDDGLEIAETARESCTQLSDAYTPPDFFTRALQHSTVELSWDRDDRRRGDLLRRVFDGEGDPSREDIDMILAPPEEEADAEAVAEADTRGSGDEGSDGEDRKTETRNRYQEMLAEIRETQARQKRERAGDFQVSFVSELSGAAVANSTAEEEEEKDKEEEEEEEEKVERAGVAGESTWDRHLEKRKSSHRLRRRLGKLTARLADYQRRGRDTAGVAHEVAAVKAELAAGKRAARTRGGRKARGDDNKDVDVEAAAAEEQAAAAEEQAAAEEEAAGEGPASAADLELLMIPDQPGAAKGFKQPAQLGGEAEGDSRKGKKKQKKKKKKQQQQGRGRGEDAELAAEEAVADTEGVDVGDERFAQLYSSHHYAIDPTAKEYRRTEGTAALMAERARRRGRRAKKEGGLAGAQPAVAAVAAGGGGGGAQRGSGGDDMAALVANVKRLAKRRKKLA